MEKHQQSSFLCFMSFYQKCFFCHHILLFFFCAPPQTPQHHCYDTFPERISQCGAQRHAPQHLCEDHPVYCTGNCKNPVNDR